MSKSIPSGNQTWQWKWTIYQWFSNENPPCYQRDPEGISLDLHGITQAPAHALAPFDLGAPEVNAPSQRPVPRLPPQAAPVTGNRTHLEGTQWLRGQLQEALREQSIFLAEMARWTHAEECRSWARCMDSTKLRDASLYPCILFGLRTKFANWCLIISRTFCSNPWFFELDSNQRKPVSGEVGNCYWATRTKTLTRIFIIYRVCVQFSLQTCCFKDYEVSYIPPAHFHSERSCISIGLNRYRRPLEMNGHPMFHIHPPGRGPRIIKQDQKRHVNLWIPTKIMQIIQKSSKLTVFSPGSKISTPSDRHWTLAPRSPRSRFRPFQPPSPAPNHQGSPWGRWHRPESWTWWWIFTRQPFDTDTTTISISHIISYVYVIYRCVCRLCTYIYIQIYLCIYIYI